MICLYPLVFMSRYSSGVLPARLLRIHAIPTESGQVGGILETLRNVQSLSPFVCTGPAALEHGSEAVCSLVCTQDKTKDIPETLFRPSVRNACPYHC